MPACRPARSRIPDLASLKAALEPAATDYLYFVAKADGSGGHQFSKSIEEHNRAVEQYRHNVKKAACRNTAGIVRP